MNEIAAQIDKASVYFASVYAGSESKGSLPLSGTKKQPND